MSWGQGGHWDPAPLLGEAYLGCSVQFWDKKDKELLGKSPVEAPRMIWGLELLSDEERPRGLGLVNLEKTECWMSVFFFF